MKLRLGNPAMGVPGARDALQALGKAGAGGGLPKGTIKLVLLRASSPPPARGDDRFSWASRNRPSPGRSWD